MSTEWKRVTLKWPNGLGDQAALVVAGAILIFGIYRLITQLIFQTRLYIPRPEPYDIALKVVSVLVVVFPLLFRDLRRRYSFLLVGLALLNVASLLLRLVRFILPQWHVAVEMSISLLWCCAAVFGVGLMRGQVMAGLFDAVLGTTFVVVFFWPLKLFGVDVLAELDQQKGHDA